MSNARRLISYKIFSAYRFEIELTRTIAEVRFIVGDSTRSKISYIDSSTFSKFTQVLISDSVATTDRIENVITSSTVFIGSSSISVFRDLIGLRKRRGSYFSFAPSFRFEFLS